MDIYMKTIIIGAAIVLGIILLCLYLPLYNKRINKFSRGNKFKLMAPYKFFSMVIITIVLASSFILILPSPVDGGNAGIDPDDDSQYDVISIKILVDLEVMDDIEIEQLRDEIERNNIDVEIIHTSTENINTDFYDIVLTKDKIVTNLYFNDSLGRRESIGVVNQILENLLNNNKF